MRRCELKYASTRGVRAFVYSPNLKTCITIHKFRLFYHLFQLTYNFFFLWYEAHIRLAVIGYYLSTSGQILLGIKRS